MSLIPEDAAQTPVEPPQNAPRRHSRLPGICFAIFTFEIGLFLAIFPWMRNTWDLNYFGGLAPFLQSIWNDPYFRGAITGVGIVNIYISCVEMVQVLKRT